MIPRPLRWLIGGNIRLTRRRSALAVLLASLLALLAGAKKAKRVRKPKRMRSLERRLAIQEGWALARMAASRLGVGLGLGRAR